MSAISGAASSADKMGPLPSAEADVWRSGTILLMLTFTARPSGAGGVHHDAGVGAFAFGNVPELQVLVVKQAVIHT